MTPATLADKPETYAASSARPSSTRRAATPAPTDSTGDRGSFLNEAQLFEIWRGQRFPEGALVTRAGVPVRVISPGRPGRGPGPDFRAAAIAGPSGVTLRGDIELHVRSSLFRAHGHLRDPAYAKVILHVVFEDDTDKDTLLPGGATAPVIALGAWVARREEELRRWLDRPLLWREPCHDAVRRLGVEGAGAALDAEGDRRFAAKTARFGNSVRVSGLGQALYEGVIEALGYGGNASAMRALARLLPWAQLWALAGDGIGAAARREGLLLGSAGLLPSQRGHRGPVEDDVAAMEEVFAASGLCPLPVGAWKLWGVRPENFPARRIAAAAALFSRMGSPVSPMEVFDAASVREAIAPLLVTAHGYWRDHYDVCAAPSRLPPALVGRSRALEILVNVVLPAAASSDDDALRAKARVLYAKLPRPAAYGVTKFIENALASEGVRMPMSARRAQGLLALHVDWCTQNGCGRCPLSG